MRDDLISRQAAIAHAVPLNLFGREVMMVSVSELENLPSVQSEPAIPLSWIEGQIDATWFEPSYTDPLNVLTEVRDRLKALPSAQPEPRWIPCSERLPEEDGLYLVTSREKATAEEFGFDLDDVEVRKMRFNEDGWRIPKHIPEWINGVVHTTVLAWMPLPEPYKERTK